MTNGPSIAVVGAGLVGRRHAALVAERARLAAIVDPDPATEALAASLGAPWYPALEPYLAVSRPDGAVLATPNQLHVAQGLACVEAGVPILVEKPVADTTAGARRLVASAEAASVPILVGHHRRHNPLIQRAKAEIDAGRLGRITAVNAQFWLYKPDDYYAPAWRRQAGAGPVFINLIHDVDLLRYLCGEVTRVHAIESNAVRGFEVEDSAGVLLQFACGAIGTISISDTAVAPWSWEFTAGENPAYPEVDTHAYTIAGTHGALSVPDLRLWHHAGVRSWWEPIESERLTAAPLNPLEAQIDHFAEVIRGSADPLVTGRDATRSLQLIEAIKQAAASGQAIDLQSD